MDIADAAGPRPHHYRFAHRVLPGLVRDLGPKMLHAQPAQGFSQPMIGLWQNFGLEQLDEHERLPSDGLRAELIELGAHRLLVVVLPRPAAPAEAYYTAVVQTGGAGSCRYFTLEAAVNPLTREAYTVLGEWTDSAHVSCGPGPEPDLSGFLMAVVELLNKGESGPGPRAGAESVPAQEPQQRRGLRKLFGR